MDSAKCFQIPLTSSVTSVTAKTASDVFDKKSRLVPRNVFDVDLLALHRAATAAKDAKDWSLPSFGSHLNPISTRGGRLCPPYTGVLGWLKFAVAALQHYLNTSNFSQHTRQKKTDRKNGFTSKITSEMELDFGWKTSSRKSRLSLLFLVFYGSELKYVLVYNWNMEKFERRGSTQRRVSKIVILCWKPRKNDPCLLSARRAVMY